MADTTDMVQNLSQFFNFCFFNFEMCSEGL